MTEDEFRAVLVFRRGLGFNDLLIRYRVGKAMQKERVTAPWSDEFIRSLEKIQAGEVIAHPYTCPNEDDEVLLTPTRHGWVCMQCGYTQNWAHNFILHVPTSGTSKSEIKRLAVQLGMKTDE